MAVVRESAKGVDRFCGGLVDDDLEAEGGRKETRRDWSCEKGKRAEMRVREGTVCMHSTWELSPLESPV